MGVDHDRESDDWIAFRLGRLEPSRFERLCSELLRKAGHTQVRGWGLAGSEGGYDLLSRGPQGHRWVTQCKRVGSLGPTAAVAALQKVVKNVTDPPPEVFLLAATCPLSRRTEKDLETEACGAPFSLKVAASWDEGHLVSELAGDVALRARFLGEKGSAAPYWNVPPRSRHFTGREDALEDLGTRLGEAGTVALTQAITGLGGVGKTQVAIEYCHRYGDRYRDVFWVVAPDAEALEAEYAHLAAELDLVRQGADQAEAAAAFLRYLSSRKDWLLVVDNVESEETWECPRSRGGHVLVTSRLDRPFEMSGRETLALDVLGENEALQLLLERSGRVVLPEGEKEAARDLAVELLGGLPLALEQAGAYLAAHRLRVSDYRDRFRLELLEKGKARGRSREETVAATWELNFEAVAKESSTAARALEICSLLSPDDIPLELFSEGWEALGLDPLEDPEVLHEQLVSPLLRYSLAKYHDTGEDAGKLSVHRLVQLVVRRSMGEEKLATTWRSTHEALDGLFPKAQGSPESWPRCELFEGQVFALLDRWPEVEAQLPTHDPTGLWLWVGTSLKDRGSYRRAQRIETQALEVSRRVLGEEHPDTLTSRNNLAGTLGALGDLAGARDLHEQALEVRRRVLGEEHPDTLTSRNNLAMTLRALGDLAGARDLHEQALEVYRRVLGEEHPDTLTSRNNLAMTLGALGEIPEARELLEQAHVGLRKLLGDDHPSTRQAAANLAHVSKQE